MDNEPARLLVATDGSGEAELAVRVAADLSGRAGSELHLVHVRREAPLAPPLPRSAYVERAFEEWAELDEHEAEQLIRRQVFEAKTAARRLRGPTCDAAGRPRRSSVSPRRSLPTSWWWAAGGPGRFGAWRWAASPRGS